MVQHRAILPMAVYIISLSNDAIFNDREWPLTQISRAWRWIRRWISQKRCKIDYRPPIGCDVACWILQWPMTLIDRQNHFHDFVWK